MNINQIKRELQANPNQQFIIFQGNGKPIRRYSALATIVSPKKYPTIYYFGHNLGTKEIAKLEQEPEVMGKDYGVLCRVTNFDGTDVQYRLYEARDVKALYSEYKQVWQEQIRLEKQAKLIETRIENIRRDQVALGETTLKSKTQAIKEFLAKVAKWDESTNNQYSWFDKTRSLSIGSRVVVEFAQKDYPPEFMDAGIYLKDDPDNFVASVVGSAEIGLELVENLMEAMLALQDENKALKIEIEKAANTNAR